MAGGVTSPTQSLASQGAISYAANLYHLGYGSSVIQRMLERRYPGYSARAYYAVRDRALTGSLEVGRMARDPSNYRSPSSRLRPLTTGCTRWRYSVYAEWTHPQAGTSTAGTRDIISDRSMTMDEVTAAVASLLSQSVGSGRGGFGSPPVPQGAIIGAVTVYSVERECP